MKWYKTFALCCFTLIACFMPCTLHAAPEMHTVRVGFFLFDGFFNRDANGTRSGYAYDYMEEIARNANWKIKYVDGSWNECLEMLERGEIDVVPGAQKNVDRMQRFAFSKLAFAFSYSMLYTSPSNKAYFFNDFEAFSNMRVGILRNDANDNGLRQFSEQFGFTYTHVPYNNQAELRQALKNGEVDALLSSSLRRVRNERIIAKFQLIPVFCIVTKSNTHILQELNDAQEALKLSDPFFESKLYTKHYKGSASQHSAMTREEDLALKKHPVLRAVYLDWLRPLSFAEGNVPCGEPCRLGNKHVCAFRGVASKVFREISRETGLKFQFFPAKTTDQALQMLQEGKADLLCSFEHNYRIAGQLNLKLSSPYMSTPYVRVVSANAADNSQYRMVLPHMFRKMGLIDKSSEIGVAEVRYLNNVEECFDALSTGKAEVTYVNIYIANQFLLLPRYQNLMVINLEDFTADSCIAFSSSMDDNLVSAFSKRIDSIPDAKVTQMVADTTLIRHAYSVRDFIHENLLEVLLTGILLVLSAVCGLIYVLSVRSSGNKRVAELINRDPLTSLPSFKKFREEGQRMLGFSSRNNRALVSININKFKYINYNYGYATGDVVLREVGRMLRDFVREGELPGKNAADRFILLLNYADLESFKARLQDFDQRLKAKVEDLHLPTAIHFSCGIYLFEPEDRDITLAIDRAHYAQETLTFANRNAYAYYNGEILERIKSEKELEDCMEEALAQGQFVPFFQPKVNMMTGALVGAEALVRWQHPEKGIISPARFVPLFERNGFITEIDLYIFREVCRFLSDVALRGNRQLPISCNFSRRHFTNTLFPQQLLDIADSFGVETHYLELEVTETVLEEDADRLLTLLHKLKALGFKIAIDDFGSGYSSLGLLNDLEADVIKVDKIFVDQLLDTNRSRNIIHLIVDIAKKLDITLICEGVETIEQADLLQKIGCVLAQGYLYGKPMPYEEFRSLFEKKQLDEASPFAHETA